MSTATSVPLRVEQGEGFLRAVLDRPEKRNAIDLDLVQALHALCDRLEGEPQVLVLSGSSGVFAGGADIGQLRERRRDDALRGINSSVFDRVAKLPLPTIAAIDGVALGGGAELAYACDLRLGTPSTKIGNPEPGLGIMAAAGATWRLQELVGKSVAQQVLLGGRTLSAQEALDCGLLLAVHDSEELEAAAAALARRTSRSDPLALRLTKLALAAPAGAHPRFDDVAQAVLFESEAKHARMTAFLEKK